MRPLEILVSLANVLMFFALVIPLPPGMRWMRYGVPVALMLVVLQIIAEGPRWQMAPAYTLTILFFLFWLFGSAAPDGLRLSRLMTSIVIGLGALGLLTAIILPIALPVFHFPKPTGPYAIGTLTYHWVDSSRPELFTPDDPTDHRELMAQVWYPAQDDPSAPRAPYIEHADSVTPGMARLFNLPEFFLTHLKYVSTNAAASAPIAEDQPRYPVLIFLSGTYGFRGVNMFQIQELVSHGYIVVGLDQPGEVALVRFPDGHEVSAVPRDVMYPLMQQSVEPLADSPTLFGQPMPEGIVPYFAADVPFALDQLDEINRSDPNSILSGRLDLDRVGLFGISGGGIIGGEACRIDQRLKACLIMDVFMSVGVVEEGLRQPALWITRDAETMRLERERAGGWTEEDIRQHQTTMRAAYENLTGDGYYVQIPGMFHLDLTDFPYWIPLSSQLGMTGTIDGQRLFDIVNAYSVAFFDQHVRGQPSPLLDGPTDQYPEVIFETRRP